MISFAESRYKTLQRLEAISAPPPAPPASDPHPGVAVFNYTGIAEAVEILITLKPVELRAVARELAEFGGDWADDFAAMILDAVHDIHGDDRDMVERLQTADATLADWVAGMVE